MISEGSKAYGEFRDYSVGGITPYVPPHCKAQKDRFSGNL